MAGELTQSGPAGGASPRRRRLRRWLVRLPLIVLAFLVALVLLTQFVLWSGIPRRTAEREIGRALGAVARIDAMRIGWGGSTRIEGLSLTLPLSDEPLVKVRSVEVVHTALPRLPFGQRVMTLHADGVQLNLREETPGRWNFLRLAVRRDAPTDVAPARARRTVELPEIDVSDVSVRVTRHDGREATINDAALRIAQPTGGVEAKVNFSAADAISVTGRIGLIGDLAHELVLRVDHLPESLRAVLPPAPREVRGELSWRGRRVADGFSGVMDVRDGRFGDVTARGSIGLGGAGGPALRIQPGALSVALVGPAGATAPLATLELDGGRVTLEGDQLQFERLLGRLNDGRVAAEGTLRLGTLDGEARVSWDKVKHADLLSSGSAELRTSRPLSGGLRAEARVRGNLRLPAGEMTTDVQLTGAGTSIESFDADLRTRVSRWTPVDSSESWLVPEMTGRIQGRGALIQLTALQPVDASLGDIRAIAAYDRSLPLWWLAIDGNDLRPERLGVGADAPEGSAARDLAARSTDLNIDVSGSHAHVDLKQFYLRQGDGAFWAAGRFDPAEADPLRLDTWVSYTIAPDPDEPDRLEGLQAHAVVAGTVAPRDLRAAGRMEASELVLRGRRIGDLSVAIEGRFTDRRAVVRSRELEVLGGQWRLRGEWTERSGRPPRVVVSWQDLPAERVGEILDIDGLHGTIATGEAAFDIPVARLDRITMDATVRATDVGYNALVAEDLQMTARLEDGTLTARPTFTRAAGQLIASIETPLDVPGPIAIKATLDRWMVPPIADEGLLADVQTRLSGDIDLTWAPQTAQARGGMSITGQITRDEADEVVGDLKLVASIVDRKLRLSELMVEAFDGSIVAVGALDLADTRTFRLDARLSNLSPATLSWMAPALADATGTYSGRIEVAPTTQPRPLGPVEARVRIESEDGAFRGIPVRSIDGVAFGAFSSPDEYRLVTERAEIHASDGVIRPFARFSQAPRQGLTQLLTASFEGLDIGPIAAAFNPEGAPVAGRTSGEVRVYGETTRIGLLGAEARVVLSRSDLANVGPVAFLYDVMRVGRAGSEPRGRGRMGLRLEQGRLSVLYANYFNRGVFIEAFGEVRELESWPDSPIDLTLVGSAQPLRDIKLPFFADADRIMQVLQTSVTTIRANGTVREPRPRQAGLEELGQTLEKILLGKTPQEN